MHRKTNCFAPSASVPACARRTVPCRTSRSKRHCPASGSTTIATWQAHAHRAPLSRIELPTALSRPYAVCRASGNAPCTVLLPRIGPCFDHTSRQSVSKMPLAAERLSELRRACCGTHTGLDRFSNRVAAASKTCATWSELRCHPTHSPDRQPDGHALPGQLHPGRRAAPATSLLNHGILLTAKKSGSFCAQSACRQPRSTARLRLSSASA